MKTILSRFAVALAAICSMILMAPAAAHAEPTGQYSYICILQNGSSYTLKPGVKLSTCKGSYLKKYINGNQVDSIRLTGAGTVAKPKNAGWVECVIAVVGTGQSTLTVVKKKGSNWKSWVGLGVSLAGLKSCIA
ncbi:hypothetical protein Aab01nite_42500 [Paractinoplanes abujensis]|uniref:Uncharacterized protein n=1 Tax=Paractinoplanes abujensis TaxID=882441 RepID=A0A7W7CSW5_9ACTN|nr:hypothetical protein [Actinoplanes abujensis]MBB4694126.1 hypothetical protein [Actinoplanes abujensis]GID20660.1 hypothetical protein Aab01nite_42500 [Actinoplanes abujensis]